MPYLLKIQIRRVENMNFAGSSTEFLPDDIVPSHDAVFTLADEILNIFVIIIILILSL